jgi:hypothetical protein
MIVAKEVGYSLQNVISQETFRKTTLFRDW